ncbi:MAG TPA: hypothetical protein VI299_09360 [Polyangiales bacterium]
MANDDVSYLTACCALAFAACTVSASGLESEQRTDSASVRDAGKPVVDAMVDSMPPVRRDAEAAKDAHKEAEDATVDAAPEPNEDAMSPVKMEDPCRPEGAYAVTIRANVHWAGSTLFGIVPIIVPGSGQLVVKTLLEVGKGEDVKPSVLRACDAVLPDFAASVGELYGAEIPDEVWDSLSLQWNTSSEFECTDPGCAMRMEPVIAQLGIGIPTQSQWPSPRDLIPKNAPRDDDDDGLPGIRLRMIGPEESKARYQFPPTSFLLNKRVREIQLAIRFSLSLDGSIDSCNKRSGNSLGTALEIRGLACRLTDGTTCATEDLRFVDDNLPLWEVDAATFTAVRLPEGATCADARAAN